MLRTRTAAALALPAVLASIVAQGPAQAASGAAVKATSAHTLLDFTGDGRADVAEWVAEDGWYVHSTAPGGGRTHTAWRAACCSIPVPADYDGDGKTDLATYDPATATWHILGKAPISFGRVGDRPASADYDGDGKADLAVFRPSERKYYIRGRSTSPRTKDFGPGTVAIPLDWTGDGKADPATFRPGSMSWWVVDKPSENYGRSGDIPAAADYDGNGRADIAVFRPETSTWYIQGLPTKSFGRNGDVPVPADYDGDGKAEAAVYRTSNGTWYFSSGAATVIGKAGWHVGRNDAQLVEPYAYDDEGDCGC